jgi:myo-inositol-1-phosphate synthase
MSVAAEARSDKPRQSAPQVAPDDLRAFTAGHNRFGLAMYRLLSGGNLFFSPYSIAQVLTMTSAGARGQTAQQMAQVLHSAFPQERLHSAANALDQALSSRGAGEDGFHLEVANSIWGQQGFAFQPEFLDTLATNYGAGLRLLDFKTAPEPSRATINTTIAQQTHDKITDLLPAGSIDANTRLVLANAIYFNAKWLAPFEKESTRERIIAELRESGAQIMVNYLPVGSEEATRFYVGCALEAGLALVNNIPVFIASDPVWAKRFEEKNLPLVGDDIKAQMGATVLHRTLVDLFRKRGVKIERTYQLNTGGNTDFLNMLNRSRLASKKTSKTEAVQSVMGARLADENIHIGPSDYVPWQNDNKICFIRVEGKLFGDVPMEIDLKLSVEDSPNSAGVAIDAIRCCKLALDRGKGGVLHSASAYFSKHPAVQLTDDEAYQHVEEFIRGERDS